MKINFCGVVLDSSGYGEFARYFIYSMYKKNLSVSVEPILLDAKANLNFGEKGSVCKKLTRRELNPDVNIINMIPPFFKKYKRDNCKNVGFTMFEADKIPEEWTSQCNEMDAIFVPCSWNKKVFEESGVTVPIYVVMPGVDETESLPKKTYNLDNEFKFYSIFQWIERKNPIGLLRAYFAEFSGVKDVSLILKTYKLSHLNNNKQLITQEILKVREELNLKHYPKVNLITDFLSYEQMKYLHNTSDCFVLPHRAEGWGLPHQEAMFYGNPVITTNFSGNVDFMNDKNSYLLNYTMEPVFGTSSYVRFYNGTMLWANPDLNHLMKTMRYVYENRALAAKVGEVGQQFIIENFNLRTSFESITKAIDEVLNA